jgi:ubiquinone biosynthesis O-methyltransferase
MPMDTSQILYTKIADLKRLQFIRQTLLENVPQPAKILDVGCGNGIITMNLARWGFTVLGIDVSEKAIQEAMAKNIFPNATFLVKSADELTADGAQYDGIVCSEVLEHLNNPSQLLRTLHQALKPSGVLIVTVPNGKGPRETLVTKPVLRLRRKNGAVWKMILKTKRILGYQGTTTQSSADNLDHVQFFSKNDLTNLLQNNGYLIVKFSKSNFIDDVFPFSFFANRITALQKIDCIMADYLPYHVVGGFNTVWKKQML